MIQLVWREGETMLSRSEARKIVMTCLYQIDICKENKIPYDVEEIYKENCSVENEFVKELLHGTLDKWNELNELGNKYLKNWTMERLDKTGSSIIRMAFYELKYMDTPPIVVINEAVELAKEYTDTELAKMINGALDKYIKEVL